MDFETEVFGKLSDPGPETEQTQHFNEHFVFPCEMLHMEAFRGKMSSQKQNDVQGKIQATLRPLKNETVSFDQLLLVLFNETQGENKKKAHF